MVAETIALLKAVQKREFTNCECSRSESAALLKVVSHGVKECFDLQMLFDEMEHAETDPDLRASLGEYRQKFGALDRELRALRDQIQKVAAIKAQLRQVHERLAKPLLELPAEGNEG
ncbi:MAG: hypothetical protein AB7G12_17510 [Thermoanaerobaculia bacterium]